MPAVLSRDLQYCYRAPVDRSKRDTGLPYERSEESSLRGGTCHNDDTISYDMLKCLLCGGRNFLEEKLHVSCSVLLMQ